MTKRSLENGAGEGRSESGAKRSRVDISDLLGDEPAATGPSGSVAEVQHTNGRDSREIESAADKKAATIRVEAVEDSNGRPSLMGSNLAPAIGEGTTQSTSLDVTLASYPSAVYVAQYKYVGEYDTDQHVMGVFIDVKQANEVVIHEFLDYHRKFYINKSCSPAETRKNQTRVKTIGGEAMGRMVN